MHTLCISIVISSGFVEPIVTMVVQIFIHPGHGNPRRQKQPLFSSYKTYFQNLKDMKTPEDILIVEQRVSWCSPIIFMPRESLLIKLLPQQTLEGPEVHLSEHF